MSERVDIWCDGSAYEGVGGWGVVLVSAAKKREIMGGQASGATNSSMELRAAIEGLSVLRPSWRGKLDVHVYSDSAYVVNCFRDGWWRAWAENGWRTSSGNLVKHRGLWETLIGLAELWEAEFHHVKGHAGNEYNERADVLAGHKRWQIGMQERVKEAVR